MDAGGCGIPVLGAGELLVSLTRADVMALATTQGIGFIQLGPIPDDPALAGFEFFAQGLWADLTAGSAEPLRLTQALHVVLGH